MNEKGEKVDHDPSSLTSYTLDPSVGRGVD